MNNDLFYALALKQKELEQVQEELNELRDKVSEHMAQEGVDKVEGDFGSFYFQSRKKWSYSDDIIELEQKLKDKKKEEQEKGIAGVEASTSLTFRKNG